MGEANGYVLGEVLGLPAAEIEELRVAGVIGERLEGGGFPNAVPLERQVELGWIAGFEADYSIE